MLALSVGLFIVIPLFTCIVYGVLLLLGYLAWFLSYSLGIITASAIIGCAAYFNGSRVSAQRSENEAFGVIFIWFLIAGFVTLFTYSFFYNAYVSLMGMTSFCWEKLMLIYEQSGIVYWSWIPIGLMFLFGAVSLLSLWIMKLLDWRPHWGIVRFICPHENCGKANSSLVYKCPSCGGTLENLHPSRYGLLSAACPHCGASVNVSWLTGRNRYSKTCPNCNRSLNYDGFGSIPESVFVVEGASKSGKTSFLFRAMSQWNSEFSEYIRFSDSQQENEVRLMAEQITMGNFCPPTPRRACPEAYLMHCKKAFHSFLAYFYDTGGVISEDIDAGASEIYYNHANGIFLVIDPWTERGILNAFGKNKIMRYSKYQFASQDADAVIGRLCSKLEHIYTDSIDTGFDIPICVVVTKCDLYALDKSMGLDNQFTQSSKIWTEQSRQIEKFLVKHGMYNFVNVVKTRFRKNAFFAVSVFDDSNDKSSSVLNPLLWMTYNVQK